MDQLKMHSPNLVDENIEKIGALFPGCITEKQAEKEGELVFDDGKPVIEKAIDFDLLKQELSKNIVEGPRERYQLNWPGKHEALLAANAPIAKTLRPCREESVDFDTTENLFIEGDNLDVLKLLQQNYLNKVKMIYIDPPYNTGKDFVYADNFSESTDEFLMQSEQTDSEGNRLVANTDSNGRFHSDWLSMIYSRIKLSRNLLKDDGVIFISIDDGEQANLKKICDEIFGEKNFVTLIIWKKRSTPPNDKTIGAQHDYILVYAKMYSKASINLRPRSEEQILRYKNPDNHAKGPWAAGDLMANVKGGRYVESLYFPIVNPRTGVEHYPSSNGNWRFNKTKVNDLIEKDEIYFGSDDNGRPKLKRFLAEIKDGITWTSLWDFAPLNTAGSKEMAEYFGNLSVFENPKPVGLLYQILLAGSAPGEIVLDFFAGSSTTAHAVMKLNSEDRGKRKFIMVQLPESCDEKLESYKSGFKTIAEISKERIRLAGTKLIREKAIAAPEIDSGFRVLKVDDSNMMDVYYSPDQVSQTALFEHSDNIKSDRTEEDLLFQLMLDLGTELTHGIHKEEIEGKAVFDVNRDEHAKSDLVACFAKNGEINEDFCKLLAKREPHRVVFRDAGFKDDSVKINVEQIFKLMSPATTISIL